MGRFREWQKGHDARLTQRYSRLPKPLQWIANLYPSQQRQKRRVAELQTEAPPPPPQHD